MTEHNFGSAYEQLEDDELLALESERGQLVAEAKAALDLELRSRKLKPTEPKVWRREQGSQETVHSLQDYDSYRELCQKIDFMGRYRYPLALGPFVLVLVLGGRRAENSAIAIGAALLWALLVVVYSLYLGFRWTAFKCPQCQCIFGRDAECLSCGFPRQ